MKKISTLFKKDPNDLSRVINEINPENEWAFTLGWPTRKFDGTACMVLNRELYKRYDVKKGKDVPIGAIPCQEPDPITGHYPHWIKCDRNKPEDKYHFEAFDIASTWADGTYELCGPKINGNHEHLKRHELILHGCDILHLPNLSYEGIMDFLTTNDIEGIVFHEMGGDRMCKIRKSDFGIKR
jgi:hypothetical protein